MAASVSGAVLSSLFFDQTNSKGDQEGFLLGQVSSRITDTITDTQLNNIKEEHTICINSFLPCKGTYSFYTSSGGIAEEKLFKVLHGREKDVVGWYKFRRNSSLQISMREKVVHQKLVNHFPGKQATHFLFGLFGTTTTANSSTHNFDCTVFQLQNGAFRGIPLQIVNLGDAAQSQYKVSTKADDKQNATMYGGIIHQYESVFSDKEGEITQVHQIQEMNSTMHRKLRNLCHGITQSECEVEALVREVEHLHHKVKDREKHIEKTESLIDFKAAVNIPKSSVAPTYSVPIEMDKTLLIGRSATPTDTRSTPSPTPSSGSTSSPTTTTTSKPKNSDPFHFVSDMLKSHKEPKLNSKPAAKSSSLPRQVKHELNMNYDKSKTNSLKVSSRARNNGHSGDGSNEDSRSQDSSDDYEKSASPMSIGSDLNNDIEPLPGSMSPVY
ncbi:BRISC complex subunit abraxas 2-like [Lineus longissimus]|uniref:BRISC complex subunit abraxas 2-like n=1 Tax=Lineus longissimus TaxID=88925 RepID=UPI002B4D4023